MLKKKYAFPRSSLHIDAYMNYVKAFLVFLGMVFLFIGKAHAYFAQCPEDIVVQCDNCSSLQQYSSLALARTPPIPWGANEISCNVYIVNLNSKTVKQFRTMRYQEPGLNINDAWELKS